MPDVELIASACDGYVVVALRGELDITGAAGAESAIVALVARGRYVVIDLSALDFIDCGALGALRRARALARRGGGDVVLAAPRPVVWRLLTLTGDDGVFWVAASMDDAVAGIAGRRGRPPWRWLGVRTARPGRAAPLRTGTG